MKKIFSNNWWQIGTSGLLFQSFVPLTGGVPGSSSSGTDLSGPLLRFFTQNNLPGLFNAMFTMALSAGAILAVLRLAYAGWLYMGAADMWGSKQHAKEVIMNAILGLLLLVGIYIILNQINPNLLNLNILSTIQNNQAQPPQTQTQAGYTYTNSGGF